MFIDTHMHEMTYSPDSFLKLEEMVRIGKEKGLGALCITDHDSMGLKDYAAEYTARTGFPIFVGIEFYSLQGDIVAFGIEDYPKERIPAQDFIDLVKAQGVLQRIHSAIITVAWRRIWLWYAVWMVWRCSMEVHLLQHV
jgi:predicted metal-dependent phosphoesterase TrpH